MTRLTPRLIRRPSSRVEREEGFKSGSTNRVHNPCFLLFRTMEVSEGTPDLSVAPGGLSEKSSLAWWRGDLRQLCLSPWLSASAKKVLVKCVKHKVWQTKKRKVDGAGGSEWPTATALYKEQEQEITEEKFSLYQFSPDFFFFYFISRLWCKHRKKRSKKFDEV